MVRHRVSADEEESSSTRDSLLSSTAASLLQAVAQRYNCLLRTKQQSFWNSRVREADGNPRKQWKTLSNLLTPAAQPVHHFTAQDFSVTFKNKVDSTVHPPLERLLPLRRQRHVSPSWTAIR